MDRPPSEPPRAALGVVFTTVLLDLLGFGMLLPVLPFYAQEYGASDAGVITLGAFYSLAQFVCSPLWGRLSDRIGRRPVMLLSISGDVLSYVLLALAHGYPLVVLARIASGVAGANFSIGQAWIADQTPSRDRSRALGLLGAAFGLGFVLGPALGAVIGAVFGVVAVPVAAGLLSLANLIYAALRFTESLPAERRTAPGRTSEWFRPRALLAALRAPRVGVLLGLMALATFAFANLEWTLALFCEDRFGFDFRKTAYLLTFVGLINAVIQGGALGPLVRRFGERRLTLAGLTLTGTGLVATALATNLLLLIAAMALTAIGVGLHSPSLYGLLSRATAEDRQGGVLGVARSLSALARGLGPLTAAVLFTRIGDVAPFWFGGLVMALTVLAAFAFFQRHATDGSC